MKRYNGVACGLAVAMLLSCSDYLKDESGDLLIPKKVDEYQSVLYGEGYPNSFTSDVEWMDLMTDDVEISTGAVPENTNGPRATTRTICRPEGVLSAGPTTFSIILLTMAMHISTATRISGPAIL